MMHALQHAVTVIIRSQKRIQTQTDENGHSDGSHTCAPVTKRICYWSNGGDALLQSTIARCARALNRSLINGRIHSLDEIVRPITKLAVYVL